MNMIGDGGLHSYLLYSCFLWYLAVKIYYRIYPI